MGDIIVIFCGIIIAILGLAVYFMMYEYLKEIRNYVKEINEKLKGNSKNPL